MVVAVLVGVSLCWLPVIKGSAGKELFVYIQTIQSYLAPPITMVFGLGILWTGLTAAGALSGLIIGFILGMAKFIVGNVYPSPGCGSVDDRPGFAKMHFMYYGENFYYLKYYRRPIEINSSSLPWTKSQKLKNNIFFVITNMTVIAWNARNYDGPSTIS